MASLLPLPDDLIATWVSVWPSYLSAQQTPFPRSAWLHDFELVLRDRFPQSSSRDRKLTARHYAPFPLAAGHDVP